MARSYLDSTVKQLFISCGHVCPFPGCTLTLIDYGSSPPTVLGEIAHIEASATGGPRGNANLSTKARDAYENLIVLCPTHHTLVDKDPNRFSAEDLRTWKAAAERGVRDRLAIAVVSVSFAEIGLICNAYADGTLGTPSTPMVAMDPGKKMDHNNLTDRVRPHLTTGLAQAGMVADFLRRQSQLVPTFPARLRSGFLAEYERLRSDGATPDDVFLGLITFGTTSAAAPQDSLERRFLLQVAAAAVLAHLFEVCDIFESPPA